MRLVEITPAVWVNPRLVTHIAGYVTTGRPVGTKDEGKPTVRTSIYLFTKSGGERQNWVTVTMHPRAVAAKLNLETGTKVLDTSTVAELSSDHEVQEDRDVQRDDHLP